MNDVIIERAMSAAKNNSCPTYEYRRALLLRLKKALLAEEDHILRALGADLGKSTEQAFMTEFAFVIHELDHVLRHLSSWMKNKKVSRSVLSSFARSHIEYRPKGCVLVISPWNYPFQLSLSPVIGALAAGNAVVLKPSEISSHCTEFLKIFFENHLPEVGVVCGDADETQRLLHKYRFDHIFFTGSTRVGSLIASQAALKHTPVTLELGGKSPAVVAHVKDLRRTAEAVVWGKTLNAGQTCVSPDYVVVLKQFAEPFIRELKQAHQRMWGDDPLQNPLYPRLIHQKHMDKMQDWMRQSEVIAGGRSSGLKMELTLTNGNVFMPDDEIFGPILPVVKVDDIRQALDTIRQFPNPLAFYIFSDNRKETDFLAQQFGSGGLCVNDTIMHLTNVSLPFGGIAQSGNGKTHGRHSFEDFSHARAVMHAPLFDNPLRYPPYKYFDWLKKIL